jgi:sporulation protein YhbH
MMSDSSENFKDIWSLKKPGSLDSKRHKQRIRKAIKENLHELIAEENIITSKDTKKIRVPVKYLDMWRFKFGRIKDEVWAGHGEGNPGDSIVEKAIKGNAGGGSTPGEDVYEEEVEKEEIIEMMLEDLDLPWLEKKDKTIEIETEDIVFQDISKRGIPSNVDKRKTVRENIMRNAKKGKACIGGFRPSDLRYRVWEHIIEQHSNAAIILMMDRSGSMTSERKYIVKSFYWWMVNFLRLKFKNVEIIFIAHHTDASEVKEEDFFALSQSGGTMVSSAFTLAKKIIEERYPPAIWNNYVFSFSDGGNWHDDNKKCLQAVKDIVPLCQAVGYGEVRVSDEFWFWTTKALNDQSLLANIFEEDSELSDNERFMVTTIEKREDIYTSLKDFLPGMDNGE